MSAIRSAIATRPGHRNTIITPFLSMAVPARARPTLGVGLSMATLDREV
jgi:hypothetical protein